MGSSVDIRSTSLWSRRSFWPALALAALLVFMVTYLHGQGRFWICNCGIVKLWGGDIWSNVDNSQQFLDPYSFSHIEHGLIFYWVFYWLMFRVLPGIRVAWRFVAALILESSWEMVENSSMMIQRYNDTTISTGYTGDTIINSLSDLMMCVVGFWLAHFLGFWRTLVLILVIEVVMILWIRDSVILNIIMLFFPVDALRDWQMGL